MLAPVSIHHSKPSHLFFAIPKESIPMAAPPEYLQDPKMARNTLPSHTTQRDNESMTPARSKSSEPISYVRSIFSSSSVSTRKQGEKVVGKVAGNFRKLKNTMGQIQGSLSSVSLQPVPFSSSSSEYPIPSETITNPSGKDLWSDDWSINKFLASPDLCQYDHNTSNNQSIPDIIGTAENEAEISNAWGGLLGRLDEPKLIVGGYPSTIQKAISAGESDCKALSESSSYCSQTITSHSWKKWAAELHGSSGFKQSGLSTVPTLHDNHNSSGNPNCSENIVGSNFQGKDDQHGIPGLDLVAKKHEPASKSANPQTEIDIAIGNMLEHKSDWEKSRNRSENPKVTERERFLVGSTKKCKLSWDIRDIDNSIGQGMRMLFNLRIRLIVKHTNNL